MRKITPLNNNGSLQLKFSVGGKRYSFNPIPGGDFSNERDMATANAIAIQISNDILSGHFDSSLDRYRLNPKPSQTVETPKYFITIWDSWVESLDLSPATKAHHYDVTRKKLVKYNPKTLDTEWLHKDKLAPSTFNKRLGYLKSCGEWAVREKLLEVNSYAAMKSRKHIPTEVKPFSLQEMKAIADGFDELFPHYAPFAKFLLLTGVRISEAIGVRWQNIDFERAEIGIKESLSIDKTGNGYQRKRKSTKTGSVRYLKMNDTLRDVLLSVQSSKPNPDALVFSTVKGCTIDSGNFRERYWLPVLERQKVPYRKIHNTRHSTLSHAIDQGTPITGVAYIAGHKDTRMVMQTYGHMINRPNLPDINI